MSLTMTRGTANRGKSCRICSIFLEKQPHIFVKYFLVFLQRQDIIRSFFRDFLRNFSLGSHGIYCYDTSVYLQQLGNCCDLIAFFLARQLSQHQTAFCGKRADHMQRRFLAILCSPGLLPIHRYYTCNILYNAPHPLHKYCMHLLRVDCLNHISEGAGIRHTVFQFDVLFQPFFLAFPNISIFA